MGAAHPGAAATGRLPQRAARRDVGRFARSLWDLLWDERRPGIRIGRRRGQLDAHRPRPSGGSVGGGANPAVIRVVLPTHLRRLAQVGGEVQLEVQGQATQQSVLDALEASYPMLRGTIRDQVSHQRRAFIRFFACEQDLSLDSPDAPLPDAVATGAEPLLVVGAMAGG